MEALLSSLLSTDVNQKLAGIERLQQRIQETNVGYCFRYERKPITRGGIDVG